MDFASYWPDWPAYVVVFISVIAAAISLDRLSWPLVAGTVSLLVALAAADRFPEASSYIIGAGFFLAVGVTYAARRRLQEGIVVALLGLIYTIMILSPHTYRWHGAAMLIIVMLAALVRRFVSPTT